LLRRLVLSGLATSAIAACSTAFAQSGEVTWRIGYFSGGLPLPDNAPPSALRQALRDLGYVEGRNVLYIARAAELKPERFAEIAQEFAALKPNVLIAVGYVSAQAARVAAPTMPIVVFYAGDPVATGMVASLARPGANVTGVSDLSAELSAKRLELLKEIQPDAGRIAVMWNARNPAMTIRYREIERAAGALKITVQPVAVRDPGDFDAAFAELSRERPDAIMVVSDALTNSNQARVLDYAAQNKVPAMYELGSVVRGGGLMSYGPRADDTFRRAAVYVDRILKGARPADLPMEQPTEYELVINLKAARSLGVTIPATLFLRADEVIQ
jgi:putative ABC transport system substrate-binding protein